MKNDDTFHDVLDKACKNPMYLVDIACDPFVKGYQFLLGQEKCAHVYDTYKLTHNDFKHWVIGISTIPFGWQKECMFQSARDLDAEEALEFVPDDLPSDVTMSYGIYTEKHMIYFFFLRFSYSLARVSVAGYREDSKREDW
ncbi:hypothetical protein NVP1015O_33 [Vibrio phage 1.015.O._10N.222.51.E5]|nr:hypothetical protein NVP1015O_33 [Vibrio phage 1.015.O._10N.222.51.E5]